MIYSGTIVSKTGDEEPLFLDGKPVHSKYNPMNEASQFALSVKDSGFIIIAGIGAGFHIKAVKERFPSSFILALEADEESLSFCKRFPVVKELLKSDNIKFSICEMVSDDIKTHYIPAVYGGITFISQRAWENENAELTKQMRAGIELTLRNISADYSVQSHFGKQWQRNLLLNLRNFKENNSLTINNSLTAAVIAAGPSLDRSVQKLLDNRKSYYIIATDTAFGTLVKNNIMPDAVISIDAQLVSRTHMFALSALKSKDTLFLFDICSNKDAAEYVKNKGYKVNFVRSAHPFSALALQKSNVFFTESGSGTVTIAACDFVRQCGFKKIELFGADFCYSSGKPYAKGTYLESNFLSSSSRISGSETLYSALMFRTELKKTNGSSFSGTLTNGRSSEILEGYERSLKDWAEKWNFVQKGNLLYNDFNKKTIFSSYSSFNFSSFLQNFMENLKKKLKTEDFSLDENTIALLPYIACLRKKDASSTKHSFFELLKLAYLDLTRYTVSYED